MGEAGRGASGDEHLAANATTTPTVLLDGSYTRLLGVVPGEFCPIQPLSFWLLRGGEFG